MRDTVLVLFVASSVFYSSGIYISPLSYILVPFSKWFIEKHAQNHETVFMCLSLLVVSQLDTVLPKYTPLDRHIPSDDEPITPLVSSTLGVYLFCVSHQWLRAYIKLIYMSAIIILITIEAEKPFMLESLMKREKIRWNIMSFLYTDVVYGLLVFCIEEL